MKVYKLIKTNLSACFTLCLLLTLLSSCSTSQDESSSTPKRVQVNAPKPRLLFGLSEKFIQNKEFIYVGFDKSVLADYQSDNITWDTLTVRIDDRNYLGYFEIADDSILTYAGVESDLFKKQDQETLDRLFEHLIVTHGNDPTGGDCNVCKCVEGCAKSIEGMPEEDRAKAYKDCLKTCRRISRHEFWSGVFQTIGGWFSRGR